MKSGEVPPDRTGSTETRVHAAGTVAITAAIALWLVVAPGRPSARTAPDAPQAGANIANVVCVGPDGIMHAAGAAGGCAAGQTALPLASSTGQGDNSDPFNQQPAPDSASQADRDALGALEAKVTALENGPLFEVVDQNGRPIFQVFPGEVLLRSETGSPLLDLRATKSAGFVTARSLTGVEASIGASGDTGGLLMTQGGEHRVEFLKQPAGNFSFKVPGANGPVAAIGESQAGTGALVIGDLAGRPRAMISVVEGKGSVQIRNGQGEAVLAMTEGATGGGLLVIGDATSEPMVKFGVAQDRYGVVLAGPVSGFPMVPGSGLPGSYLLGCAGGAKCGPDGGGQRR